ncbi:hypothetical protein SAMN04487919_12658 [Bacillus sp. ok061]|nr:hypothetical protein SAMN04487919_12658 [Bacillus sp. ok061]
MKYSLQKTLSFFTIPIAMAIPFTLFILCTLISFNIEPTKFLGDFYFNLQESITISVWNLIKASTIKLLIPSYLYFLVTWTLIYVIWKWIKKSLLNIIKDNQV